MLLRHNLFYPGRASGWTNQKPDRQDLRVFDGCRARRLDPEAAQLDRVMDLRLASAAVAWVGWAANASMECRRRTDANVCSLR
jgi:hypothetical protein